jgi:hypothetical protein
VTVLRALAADPATVSQAFTREVEEVKKITGPIRMIGACR